MRRLTVVSGAMAAFLLASLLAFEYVHQGDLKELCQEDRQTTVGAEGCGTLVDQNEQEWYCDWKAPYGCESNWNSVTATCNACGAKDTVGAPVHCKKAWSQSICLHHLGPKDAGEGGFLDIVPVEGENVCGTYSGNACTSGSKAEEFDCGDCEGGKMQYMTLPCVDTGVGYAPLPCPGEKSETQDLEPGAC